MLLIDIAKQVRIIVREAEIAGIHVDEDNVVDLIMDNITGRVSISDIRAALVVAGYSVWFPKATR